VVLLRYFNPIGAHKSGLIGEDPNGMPNNIMPIISKTAIGEFEQMYVFGNDYDTPDGSCIRDFIHISDLADGHLKALNYIDDNSNGILTVNLGTGNGYSVLDLVHNFEKATGVSVPYVITERRAGDIAFSYADATKAKKELLWEAKYGIEEMCKSSWNFIVKNKK
jgi:UDP-glucose 4-epimerase